eukprot:2045286-Pyramimonas_sp.AAC.1
MTPTREVDLHSQIGYRGFNGGEDGEVKGCGIRGASLQLRGHVPNDNALVLLVDACNESHRWQ